MKYIFIFLSVLIYGLKCNEDLSQLKFSRKKEVTNDALINSTTINPGNYSHLKERVDSLRKQIAFGSGNIRADEQKLLTKAKKVFFSIVTDSIIPYWKGTKWSFYGTTEQPQSGSIACGYFVTTVLRDAGVRLNRVKLSQCASEEMITSLVSKNYIRRFRNIVLSQFLQSIMEQGKGLYIVGLDNHTGFIVYDTEGMWFVHSSYVYPGAVAKQDANTNMILSRSKYRITGKISDDESFIFRWLH